MAATPPAPPAEALWAVDYPDGQDREFTTAEVIAELERGAVTGTTLVWRDGMAEWLEVHQVPELARELKKIEAKKMAAAIAAAKATTPIHKPRAPMPTVTGLGGLPGAGDPKPKVTQPSSSDALTPLPKPRVQQTSSPELAKPRVQQTSSPELFKPRLKQTSSPELAKPRVQQTSSPELFKPRLKQPSSPELAKPGFQQASTPVMPQAMPPAAPPPVAPAPPVAPTPLAAPPPPPPAPLAAPPPVTPPLPFAVPPDPLQRPEQPMGATPPLPASVAKVVSRPPQIQPAFPMAPSPVEAFGTGPALVSDHASVEWPEAKKSKAPLIIVAVLVVAAIVVAAVMLGRKDEAPAPAPISALPANPAATPPSPVRAAPRPGATEPEAETATGSDPVATAPDPGATPGAGFAELFAAGARKAETKGSTVAPTARFDAAATKAPLAKAAADAQACKQGGGPTGKVTVVVTFDPSGRVSGATISDPPFAGTATASCISSALKRATIAPFSGLPGTVSKTFSIL
jgi:hypothetical protein